MSMADLDGLIWFDGEMVPWEDAKVHVLTHTLHYGMGVFEGVRAYNTDKGAAIFRLDEHTDRLFNSAPVNVIFETVCDMVKTQDFKQKESTKRAQEALLEDIAQYQKNQVRRIKHGVTNTRNSVLYLSILSGTKDLLIDVIRLLKVQSKFTPVLPKNIILEN